MSAEYTVLFRVGRRKRCRLQRIALLKKALCKCPQHLDIILDLGEFLVCRICLQGVCLCHRAVYHLFHGIARDLFDSLLLLGTRLPHHLAQMIGVIHSNACKKRYLNKNKYKHKVKYLMLQSAKGYAKKLFHRLTSAFSQE